MQRPVHGGNLVWAAQQAGCPISSIVDFSASINPLGPPAIALDTIRQGLATLTTYPDPDYNQLRSALAKWHQLPPEWVLPGNGAAELLTWASRELAQQEMTILITPAFGDYWRALNAFEAKIQPHLLQVEAESYSLSVKISSNPEKAGLLLNNPHNPSGYLWSRETITPLLEQFALVVVDEAFMDFLPPHQQQSLIPLIETYPNLVIVRSLTKFYSLPGLRLGYAIAHPERLQRWQRWRDPWSVNSLAAIVAEAVIKDTQFQQKTWNWLLPTRNQLFEGLSALKGLQPRPSAANFLLVRTDYPSSQLQAKLLKTHRLLIRDCLSFTELGDRFFRVAVRTVEDNQRLLDGLATIIAEG